MQDLRGFGLGANWSQALGGERAQTGARPMASRIVPSDWLSLAYQQAVLQGPGNKGYPPVELARFYNGLEPASVLK